MDKNEPDEKLDCFYKNTKDVKDVLEIKFKNDRKSIF